MVYSIKMEGHAIKYITELLEIKHTNLILTDPKDIISLIKRDFENNTFQQKTQYFESILNMLPSDEKAIFLNTLIEKSNDKEFNQIIAQILIQGDRPIYQIKALELIQKIEDPSFVPFIIELIHSPYKPLQKKAVETILYLKGTAEQILEMEIFDRSPVKREMSAKILTKLNPYNIKLAQYYLEKGDFLERINSIKILANTKDKKWIQKIEKKLEDEDLAVRKAAIEGIMKIGGRKAKKSLTKHLDFETHPPLKELLQKILPTIK